MEPLGPFSAEDAGKKSRKKEIGRTPKKTESESPFYFKGFRFLVLGDVSEPEDGSTFRPHEVKKTLRSKPGSPD
jgi:hypothetical protein